MTQSPVGVQGQSQWDSYLLLPGGGAVKLRSAASTLSTLNAGQHHRLPGVRGGPEPRAEGHPRAQAQVDLQDL